ncbi:MAG: phage/plasmid primase, P4 family [Nitrososphaera sp.]
MPFILSTAYYCVFLCGYVIVSTDTVRPATILSLHDLGFKLVPLSNDAKKPVMAWTPIYDQGWEKEELSQSYGTFANVATCFGKSQLKDQDGRDLYLNCLDIDSDKIYYELFNQPRAFTAWAAENTYCTKTRKPNGWHVYWLSHDQNKAIKSERCTAGYEFEIKTDKGSGLATLPPSRHRDDPKFRYQALGREDRIIVSDELYPSLVKLLGQFLTPEAPATSDISFAEIEEAPTVELTDGEIGEIVTELKPLYRKGDRHAFCLHLAGYLHKNCIDIKSAEPLFDFLTDEDEEHRGRMQALKDTFAKKRSEVSGYRAFFDLLKRLKDEKTAKTIVRKIYKVILAHKEDPAFELAQTLEDKFIFRTLNDTREILYYESGRYLPNGERKIETEAAIIQADVKTAVVNEAKEMIRRATPADRKHFDANPSILNVKNGLLDTETGKLLPHDPEYLSRVQLPLSYDPFAECPAIDGYLSTSLDPTNRDRVAKMLGDILMPDYRYQSLYFLVGSGNNGKGTLGRLIRPFVGPENCSAVRLQALSNDRFSKAHLYGKMVNFAGDVSAGDIKDLALVRSLTGGDLINAEYKNQPAFEFVNCAKLIFAFNKPPDLDDAFSTLRRLVLIVFEKIFSEDEADDGLDDKLQTPAELSGLLNLALKGIKKLKQDRGYSNESWKDTKREYLAKQNHVAAFVNDELLTDPTEKMFVEDLQKIYVEYCKKKAVVPLDNHVLGSKLAELDIENKRRTEKGIRNHYYLGVKRKVPEGQTTVS